VEDSEKTDINKFNIPIDKNSKNKLVCVSCLKTDHDTEEKA
jgi:hypothetical protein